MSKSITLFGFAFAASLLGKDVMLMNRIGPSKSELYVANADGSKERKLFSDSGFDYHASYSYDGKWIVFTSERSGYGQADIYRVHPDGSGLEQLTNDPAVDDQAVLSPDNSQLAFVSTRETHRANICILDLKTKHLRSLTVQPGIQGDPMKPDAFLRPAWSPDGQWIAFSSDRNTEWTDHGNHTGWEHLQQLSIYVVHPDGSGLRRLTGPGVCSGSPKWSADSKQIVFYEMPVETTWDARIFFRSAHATSQIVSVDLASGKRTEQTSGPGLKLMPQSLPNGQIGFLTKAGVNEGVGYSKGNGNLATGLAANGGTVYTGGEPKFPGSLRSPAWSPDGKQVVYERVDYTPRPQISFFIAGTRITSIGIPMSFLVFQKMAPFW